MPKRGRFSRGPVGLTRMTDRRVMRFVAPEKKYLDVVKVGGDWTVVSNTTLSSTAVKIGPLENSNYAGTLGGFAQGSGASDRIGSKIAIESIQCKFNLAAPGAYTAASAGGATTLYSPHVRVMLVHDKQPNGVIAAATDILTLAAVPSASTDCTQAIRELANTARFSVLYDKVHLLDQRASNTSQGGAGAIVGLLEPKRKYISINKKFKKPIIREFTTGAAVTNAPASTVMKHQFLLVVLHDDVSAQGVVLDGVVRFRFSDA
jgi:hypothetical protein